LEEINVIYEKLIDSLKMSHKLLEKRPDLSKKYFESIRESFVILEDYFKTNEIKDRK